MASCVQSLSVHCPFLISERLYWKGQITFPILKPDMERRARQWLQKKSNVGLGEATSSEATTSLYLNVTMKVLQSSPSMLNWEHIIALSKTSTRIRPISLAYTIHPPHVNADDIFVLGARGALRRLEYEPLRESRDRVEAIVTQLHGTAVLKDPPGSIVLDWNNTEGALFLPAWRMLQLRIKDGVQLFTWVQNWVVVEIRKLFYEYGLDETQKTWELATMAVLTLRKAMLQVLQIENGPPTMKEICEGLDVHHNVDDSILAKRASPNTASNAFRSRS